MTAGTTGNFKRVPLSSDCSFDPDSNNIDNTSCSSSIRKLCLNCHCPIQLTSKASSILYSPDGVAGPNTEPEESWPQEKSDSDKMASGKMPKWNWGQLTTYGKWTTSPLSQSPLCLTAFFLRPDAYLSNCLSEDVLKCPPYPGPEKPVLVIVLRLVLNIKNVHAG